MTKKKTKKAPKKPNKHRLRLITEIHHLCKTLREIATRISPGDDITVDHIKNHSCFKEGIFNEVALKDLKGVVKLIGKAINSANEIHERSNPILLELREMVLIELNNIRGPIYRAIDKIEDNPQYSQEQVCREYMRACKHSNEHRSSLEKLTSHVGVKSWHYAELAGERRLNDDKPKKYITLQECRDICCTDIKDTKGKWTKLKTAVHRAVIKEGLKGIYEDGTPIPKNPKDKQKEKIRQEKKQSKKNPQHFYLREQVIPVFRQVAEPYVQLK